jgi:putative DNA methylase
MRGIAMMWNWVDVSPLVDFTGSWMRVLSQSVEGLSYLLSTIHNVSPNLLGKEQAKAGVKVLLDDATVLSKLDSEERFDLIVTDPPYYDDVPYTELSDFYFVWLKRALSESQDSKLVPRFHRKAFFKEIDGHWIEIRTQWEEFATREVSLNPPRLGKNSELKDAIAYFQSLLDASFMNMNSLLKEDGLLVTYYAHTNPDAWKALLKSGWEASGLTVSNAFPITTESAQSVVKRGKLSLDTSIVVVWRKGALGSIQASKLYEQMIEATKTRTRSAIEMKIHGRDLWVGALAVALSEATRFKEIIEMKNLDTAELMDKYVLRATLHGLTEAISQKAQVEQGVRSNEGMLYLVIKFLYSGSAKKIVTSDDARIFSLGTGVDLSYAINSLRLFRAGSEEEEGVGSSLAKRKTLVLLDPQTKDRIRLKDLLDYRGLDTEAPNIRCSIDALHILEYYALTYPRQELLNKLTELKTKFPAEVDEAISLARVISGSLECDIERDLCNTLIEKTMIKTLTEYSGGS